MRVLGALIAAAWPSLGGCRGPRVELIPIPADAAIYVDGGFVAADEDSANRASLVDVTSPAGRTSPVAESSTPPTAPGQRTIPFRYYGELAVSALPPGEQLSSLDQAPKLGVRQLVAVETPAPRYLFPFDFAIEMLSLPFVGMGDLQIQLALPEDPGAIEPGQEPPDGAELLQRAQASRSQR